MDADTDVILPAAGTSERMKNSIAKQFLKILGRHIIAYTVDSFHRIPRIRHIIITVNSNHVESTQKLMTSYGFDKTIVTSGGETRHRSIFCGVKALQQLPGYSGSSIVIIHDAARPFVPEHITLKVAESAHLFGAAGVTRPLVSTVIRGGTDGKLTDALDRRLYRNSEMPQAFRLDIIANAYEKSSEDDFNFGTECLLLAMKYSDCQAFLVEGTDDLWKVTYQKDLYSMESIVKEKFTQVSIINMCKRKRLTDIDLLNNTLKNLQLKVTDTEKEPANTFVILLESKAIPDLQELTSTISHTYSRLPNSAVNLRLYVLLVFVWNPSSESQLAETQGLKQLTKTPVCVLSYGECQPETHPKDAQLSGSDVISPAIDVVTTNVTNESRERTCCVGEKRRLDSMVCDKNAVPAVSDVDKLKVNKPTSKSLDNLGLCSAVVKQVKEMLESESSGDDSTVLGICLKISSHQNKFQISFGRGVQVWMVKFSSIKVVFIQILICGNLFLRGAGINSLLLWS
ncbi:unnamed protein product [Lymnaea stagnalis]|uniref:2-C-methyl-D-erythritol 4-phosphate cytidylyltransferase-like protein n=1 Tax=Lymnaea stagnalis TaxID=6523 RepID=A0AAV2HBP8_LYMST